eukprot:m.113253 g.113253  ORF g.113253 m.113253 type:complete len:524 (-) comp28258_c0_seq1:51-1622(-)
MSDDEAIKIPPAEPRRRLGVLGLLLIAFFWVSGGIYGNEALIGAGPPGYVFLLLILTPLFYAIPVALITGELSTSLPYDGGLVAWVDEACGPFIGAQCTFWLWTSYVFDGSIYPVLAAEYIGTRADLDPLGGDETVGKKVVALFLIGAITLVKLAGTDWMVRSTGIFFVGSLIPCLIFIFYGSKDIDPKTWTDIDVSEDAGGIDVSLMVSWVLWLSSGFFSLGCLAGEVHNPSRTYPLVIVIIIPLVALLNIWPLAVSLSMDQDRFNYEAGHFDELASQLLGDWLGYAFVIGAVFCNVGLYNAQILVCERSLAAMLDTYVRAYRAKASWKLSKYLLSENGTGVAPIFIILHALIAMVFIWLPYEQLVELSILQMTLPSILCLYAFLYFKYFQPKLSRPFAIPGKVVGGVISALPVFLFTLANFYFAVSSDEEVLEMPYGKAIGFTAITVAGLLVHGVYKLINRYVGGNAKETPQGASASKHNDSFDYTNDEFAEDQPLLTPQQKHDIAKQFAIAAGDNGHSNI